LSVTKRDLAESLKNMTELSQKDSSVFVNETLNFIKSNLSKEININGFGSFKIKKSPKRIGRNPKTLKEYVIKPSKKIKFFASKIIRKDFN
tara:strand:- start:1423 stop:1695 length:273 start_codon:yes stop_codon:yes gene_type:complete